MPQKTSDWYEQYKANQLPTTPPTQPLSSDWYEQYKANNKPSGPAFNPYPSRPIYRPAPSTEPTFESRASEGVKGYIESTNAYKNPMGLPLSQAQSIDSNEPLYKSIPKALFRTVDEYTGGLGEHTYKVGKQYASDIWNALTEPNLEDALKGKNPDEIKAILEARTEKGIRPGTSREALLQRARQKAFYDFFGADYNTLEKDVLGKNYGAAAGDVAVPAALAVLMHKVGDVGEVSKELLPAKSKVGVVPPVKPTSLAEVPKEFLSRVQNELDKYGSTPVSQLSRIKPDTMVVPELGLTHDDIAKMHVDYPGTKAMPDRYEPPRSQGIAALSPEEAEIEKAKLYYRGDDGKLHKRVIKQPMPESPEAAEAMRHKKISGETATGGDYLADDPFWATIPDRLRPEAPNVTNLRNLSEGTPKAGAYPKTNRLQFENEQTYLDRIKASEAAEKAQPTRLPSSPSPKVDTSVVPKEDSFWSDVLGEDKKGDKGSIDFDLSFLQDGWQRLKEKLGRTPTTEEMQTEANRIRAIAAPKVGEQTGRTAQFPRNINPLLRKMDYLGFDSIRQVKQAILQHDDWATRWQIDDPQAVKEIEIWKSQQPPIEPSYWDRFKNKANEQNQGPSLPPVDEQIKPKFQVGDLVRHKTYGVGRIAPEPGALENMSVQELDNYIDKVRKNPHPTDKAGDTKIFKEINDEFRRRREDPNYRLDEPAKQSARLKSPAEVKNREFLDAIKKLKTERTEHGRYYNTLSDELDSAGSPEKHAEIRAERDSIEQKLDQINKDLLAKRTEHGDFLRKNPSVQKNLGDVLHGIRGLTDKFFKDSLAHVKDQLAKTTDIDEARTLIAQRDELQGKLKDIKDKRIADDKRQADLIRNQQETHQSMARDEAIFRKAKINNAFKDMTVEELQRLRNHYDTTPEVTTASERASDARTVAAIDKELGARERRGKFKDLAKKFISDEEGSVDISELKKLVDKFRSMNKDLPPDIEAYLKGLKGKEEKKPPVEPAEIDTSRFRKGIRSRTQRAFVSDNPELKGILDRLIKYRSAGDQIGKAIRDRFAHLAEYTKSPEDILKFQEEVNSGKYPEVRQFFDTLYNKMSDEGIELRKKEDYLPQLWDATKEEVTKAYGDKQLNSKASFQFRSTLKDYAEGIGKLKKPKMSPVDFMEWYGKRANKLIADNAALKALKEKGYIVTEKTAKAGMPAMDSNLGGFQGYYAHPEVKSVLENYLKSPQTVSGEFLHAIKEGSGKMTSTILSAGLWPKKPLFTFHGLSMGMPGLSRSFMEGGVKRNLQALKFGWSPKAAAEYLKTKSTAIIEATQKYGFNASVESPGRGPKLFENEGGKLGFVKKGANKLTEFQHKYWEGPLFEQMIPALKFSAWEENFKNFQEKGMSETEAGHAATKLTNSFYSGRNIDLLYNHRSFNTVARALLLAPDWLRSTASLGGNIPKSFADAINENGRKNPLAKRYRSAGWKILGAYAVANLMQKAMTGKFMVQNDTKDMFNMKLGSDASGEKDRSLNVFGSAADAFKLAAEMATAVGKGEGGGDVLSSFVEGRLSPPVSAAIAGIRGEDFKGERNWFGPNTDRFGNPVSQTEKLGNTLAQTFNFMPPIINQPYRYLMGRATGEEALSKMAEFPLSYRTKKTPAETSPFNIPTPGIQMNLNKKPPKKSKIIF